MKNRIVGGMVIGISVLVGFIIYSFNKALKNIVSTTCSHGTSCPMWQTVSFQTNISLGIMVFILLIGFYLMFFSKEEKIVKKIVKQKMLRGKIKKPVVKELSKEEKTVFDKIVEAKGTIFQAELVEKLGMSKVKVTRILDKLEGKGIVERKRRGMSNVVVLKH